MKKWPKLFFIPVSGGRVRLEVPRPSLESVAPGGACPKCGDPGYQVTGTGKRPSEDDRAYEADAHCLKCQAYVGTLRVEVNTLFGVREDNAVLNGRCRVY